MGGASPPFPRTAPPRAPIPGLGGVGRRAAGLRRECGPRGRAAGGRARRRFRVRGLGSGVLPKGKPGGPRVPAVPGGPNFGGPSEALLNRALPSGVFCYAFTFTLRSVCNKKIMIIKYHSDNDN